MLAYRYRRFDDSRSVTYNHQAHAIDAPEYPPKTIFGSETDTISLLILFFFLLTVDVFVGATLFQKQPEAPLFQVGLVWKSDQLYI